VLIPNFRSRWRFLALALTVSLLGSLPLGANGQVIVTPSRSLAGATEKYVVRVSNRHPFALTQIELRFPRSVRALEFGDVPGWPVRILADSAKRVTAAVWTGTLDPSRFVELSFLAVNPSSEVALYWPVAGTFANGERIEWPERVKSRKPSSMTTIAGPEKPNSLKLALAVMLIAVVLSVVALTLSLRSDTSFRGGFQPGA